MTYLNLQLSHVTLPSIGVAAHRVCLSHRPGLRRLTPAASEPQVGPSVTPDLDNASQGIWGLISLVMVAMLVAGCTAVAMVHR